MKRIILSRKGFDSSAGGVASPIFENGKIFSIPIPQKSLSPHKYKDLYFNGISGKDALLESKAKSVDIESYCHFDPFLTEGTGIFGQISRSQTELKQNLVGIGDLFLFFGWFKQYSKKGKDLHHLFGWLQIDKIIEGSNNIKKYLKKAEIIHPHGFVESVVKNKINAIYVGKKNLNYSNNVLSSKGFGLFNETHQELILTEKNSTRSKWRFPEKYFSKTQDLFINRLKWKDKKNCLVDYVGYGQEFILDVEKNPKVVDWAIELINKHGNKDLEYQFIEQNKDTTKNNVDFILFAVTQTKEALQFGFTLNECRRNLNTALHQYWQSNIMKMSSVNKSQRDTIKKSKMAIIAYKNKSEKLEIEHAVPIKVIVDLLLDLTPLTSIEIENLLNKYFRVCMVTKSEHKKLSDAKLRSKMPDDWDNEDPYARYKKVGIKCN